MAVGDQGGGAQCDGAGDSTDSGQHRQRLVELAVGRLELPMGLEQDVVSHPHRVEAELLSTAGSVHGHVPIGIFAEVGE